MFTLRLFIMGMVALVPSDNSDDLTLILPALQSEEHGHVPVLVCDPRESECKVCTKAVTEDGCPENYQATGRDADQWLDIVRELNLDRGLLGAGRILDGVAIRIEGAEPGFFNFAQVRRPRRWLDNVMPRGRYPRAPRPASASSWVPAISDLHDQAGTVEEAHLTKPDSQNIAALLPFQGIEASMMSYRFPVIRSPRRAFVHSLTFRKEKGFDLVGIRQAAPDVVLIEVVVRGERVRFELQPFQKDAPAHIMELARKDPKTRVVDVLLGNLTPLRDDEELPCVGSPVEHFKHYYDLSERRPESCRVPRIGETKVDAGLIMRDLPSVVRLVSRRRRSVGGVDRPVCTKAEFVSSLNQLSPPAGLFAAAAASETATPPQGETSVDMRRRFTREEAEEDLEYFARGKNWKFKLRHDAAVVVAPSGRYAALEPLAAETAAGPPLLETTSEDSEVQVIGLDERYERDEAEKMFTEVTTLGGETIPVLADEERGELRYVLPDRLRVWFKPEVSAAKARDAAEGVLGAGVRMTDSQFLPGYYTVWLPPQKKLFKTIQEFSVRSEVDSAEPADVGLGRLPAMARRAAGPVCAPRNCTAWGASKVKAPEAWRGPQGAEGEGVIVAVVDTGIDLDHPSFSGKLVQQQPGEDWDFAGPDTEPEDENGHGTHVAGIILQVAPQAKILPLRVDLGDGDDRHLAEAIGYVAKRAAEDPCHKYVLNMSWTLGVEKDAVLKAIRLAMEQGVVAVAAVGNDPHDLGEEPEYPAAEPGVLAVAATYDDDVRTFDSNYGREGRPLGTADTRQVAEVEVDVSAPGWGIRSAWNDGGFSCVDGTSMAAAHVSGVAALVRSKCPSLEVSKVQSAIEDSAESIDDKNLRFEGALGKGRVDAAVAVRKAAASCPLPDSRTAAAPR